MTEPAGLADEARDRSAIAARMGDYVEAIDRGDFDGLLELFAEDGALQPHGHPPYRGREEIRGFIAGSRKSRPTSSRWGALRHHVSSLRVGFTAPGEARATSYFVAMSALGADHWGTYRDELKSVDGSWLFGFRAVTLDGADPDGWVGSGAATVKLEVGGGRRDG